MGVQAPGIWSQLLPTSKQLMDSREYPIASLDLSFLLYSMKGLPTAKIPFRLTFCKVNDRSGPVINDARPTMAKNVV